MERINPADNIIKIRTKEQEKSALEKAGQVLSSGGIVAYPTESYYGLAVDIENREAINRLFLLKNREPAKPILILIPDTGLLNEYAAEIPDMAVKLMDEFWPGGLTMLFKAGRKISPLLTAGSGKIGIRHSGHPLASALAGVTGRPVTGTSSNISGSPPCTRASEVSACFGNDVDLIIDSGDTRGGKGSTILDITTAPPVILREGIVLEKDILKITGL